MGDRCSICHERLWRRGGVAWCFWCDQEMEPKDWWAIALTLDDRWHPSKGMPSDDTD